MRARVLLLLATATVAQSRQWFAHEVSCWITQEKVPATWEDAQRRCERHGAVLASPLNTQLYNYLQSRINVQNESVAYFIGTRAERSDDGQEVDYVSVEGRRLEDMPMVVFDAIKLLDLEQGDCLSMDRHGIRAVSCWDLLPYICYSKEATECGSALTTTQASTTASAPTTTTCIPTTTASTPTTTTSAPPPTTTLLPGYKYYAATGSAYKIHKTSATWYVAKATCAGEGAHLVVLNDAVEADIIARIAYDDGGMYSTWTGLHDNRLEGVREWRTVLGEPLSDVYHEWFDGYPHNDARYTCVNFYAGNKRLYNDYTCATTLYFTCERAQ